jgi:hypothetical protein
MGERGWGWKGGWELPSGDGALGPCCEGLGVVCIMPRSRFVLLQSEGHSLVVMALRLRTATQHVLCCLLTCGSVLHDVS